MRRHHHIVSSVKQIGDIGSYAKEMHSFLKPIFNGQMLKFFTSDTITHQKQMKIRRQIKKRAHQGILVLLRPEACHHN